MRYEHEPTSRRGLDHGTDTNQEYIIILLAAFATILGIYILVGVESFIAFVIISLFVLAALLAIINFKSQFPKFLKKIRSYFSEDSEEYLVVRRNYGKSGQIKICHPTKEIGETSDTMYSEARGSIRSRSGHARNGSENRGGSMKPIRRLESLQMSEKRQGVGSVVRKEVRFGERDNFIQRNSVYQRRGQESRGSSNLVYSRVGSNSILIKPSRHYPLADGRRPTESRYNSSTRSQFQNPNGWIDERSIERAKLERFKTSYDRSLDTKQYYTRPFEQGIELSKQKGILLSAFQNLGVTGDRPINMILYLSRQMRSALQQDIIQQEMLLSTIQSRALELFGLRDQFEDVSFGIRTLRNVVSRFLKGQEVELLSEANRDMSREEFRKKVSQLNKTLSQLKDWVLIDNKKDRLLYYMQYVQKHYLYDQKLVLIPFSKQNASFSFHKKTRGEVLIGYDLSQDFAYVLGEQKNHDYNFEETMLLAILLNKHKDAAKKRSKLAELMKI